LEAFNLPIAPFSIDELKVTILIYEGTENLALIDETSEFLQQNADQFLLKLGFSYFAGIGQGDEYHQGFYGPLPVPYEKKYVSFVFSTIALDRTQGDPRANGSSYVLVCLICQKSRVPRCIDRPSIEAAFKELFAELNDINDIDQSFANGLKTILIEAAN
ncbi:MAG: hypothetical protein ACFFB3_15120, partial [Candidatus Hodarchaeota archaeon]